MPHSMTDAMVESVGTACNVLVAMGLGTLGTMEMFDPVEAGIAAYVGLPSPTLSSTDSPASMLARHLVAVVGGMHVGMAVLLLLSVRMDSQSRQAVALSVFASLVLHIASIFREPAFAGQYVTSCPLRASVPLSSSPNAHRPVKPTSMPVLPLLVAISLLLIAIVCENDIDENTARGAVLTGERKEFKVSSLFEPSNAGAARCARPSDWLPCVCGLG
eukprot:COSAG05_NODE_2598_length_2859_cov_9.278623_1_plen_217_part_00